MLRSLVFASLLLFAAPKGATDSAVVGSWGLEGHSFVVFKADGTGTMADDSFTWTSDGKTISVKSADGETDQMAYSVQNGQLTLVANGVPMVLSKIGKLGKALLAEKDEAAKTPKEGKPAKEPKEPAAGNSNGGGHDDLAKLLLSSPWCTFHYSQVSGTSSSERTVYSPDGTWSKGGQAETYSSGYGGTASSQSNTGDRGRWKTEKNQLYVISKETYGQWFGPIALTVTKNSNGYPIITSNGVEYSTCR